MRWSQLVFVHWQLRPEVLRPRLPRGLELELLHGAAYLTLVGLHARGPMPEPLLGTAVDPLGRYRQLSLRTYVVGEHGGGVFLLGTRVDRALPLAARLLGMPYHLDRSLEVSQAGDQARLACSDFTLEGEVDGDGPWARVAPLGVGHFLLDRFRTYGRLPGGRLYSLEIAHEPWRIRGLALSAPAPSAAVGIPGAAASLNAHIAHAVHVGITAVHLDAVDFGEPRLS